jgi:ATP-dependent Clp protease protease subunit
MTKEKKAKAKEEPSREDSRNVYVFGRLENEVTVPVIRRLLRLAELDAHAPITLYINSSGGNGYNADAIIAIMNSIKPKVNTVCLGHALSGACEILAAGTGERSAYEFSTIMFHQTIWEAEGDITNLEIQAAQGQRFRNAQIELLHKCTGASKERLRKDIERDYYMSAEDALEYGMIDKLIRHKGRNAAAPLKLVAKPAAKTAAKPAAKRAAASRVSTRAKTAARTTRTRKVATRKTTKK